MHRLCTRSIVMAALLAAAPWQTLRAAPPFAQAVPTSYPTFDEGTGSLSLVVAELVATDYLKAEECPKPQIQADGTTRVFLCMDPPPTWFRARVLQHVAGADVGEEFYAVTGSHYGAMRVGAAEPAKLMLLRSNGTALEMLRYRAWPVARSNDGQYHLVVQNGPIHWLPCWTASLMREIDDGAFATDLAIPREEYDSLWAKRHAAFYRVGADGVRPRFAIPVTGVQQGLKNQPLALTDFACTTPAPTP